MASTRNVPPDNTPLGLHTPAHFCPVLPLQSHILRHRQDSLRPRTGPGWWPYQWENAIQLNTPRTPNEPPLPPIPIIFFADLIPSLQFRLCALEPLQPVPRFHFFLHNLCAGRNLKDAVGRRVQQLQLSSVVSFVTTPDEKEALRLVQSWAPFFFDRTREKAQRAHCTPSTTSNSSVLRFETHINTHT